jgi:hypothetical protein
MTLRDAFAALTSNLEAVKAQYALIGGLAVSTRVEPRMTRDVDVV